MKTLKGLALATTLLTFGCQPPATPPTETNNEFIVLQLNDVYEIAPLEGGKYAGLERVATVRKQLLEENPNVITVLAGDFVNPSLIGTLKGPDGEKVKGKHMIEVLNALQLDLATFGNHEFDLDEKYIVQRLFQSEFYWTSANAHHITQGDTVPFQQLINGDTVDVSTSQSFDVKFKDGQNIKVAFIGNVLPFNQQDYVHYTDQYQEVIDEYQAIKEQNNIVLGLTHQSIDEDKKLAGMLQEIPLYLGGHEHVNMKHTVGKSIITKADANAKTVYVHRIKIDKEGNFKSLTSELVSITDQIKSDTEVKKVVDKWQLIAENAMNNMGFDPAKVVGSLPEGVALDGKETSLRYQPCNMGQLTAQAMYEVTKDQGAQGAFFNSGSIRLDDVLTGNITEFDVLRSFPYGGGIVILNIQGKDLIETLETGTTTNVGLGGYLQCHNLEKVNDQWTINGEVINNNKTYKVTTTDFVSKGLESNLEALGNVPQDPLAENWMNASVKNDIRNIFIYQTGINYPVQKD